METAIDTPTANPPVKSLRVQLDFSPEAVRRLLTVKEMSESPTNAEAIRKALKFYEWFLKQKQEDARLVIVKGDQQREVEFVL